MRGRPTCSLTALLLAVATTACGHVTTEAEEADASVPSDAALDTPGAHFDVVDPETPDARIPECKPAGGGAWADSPFRTPADPSDCMPCGCEEPGAIHLRVGDHETTLTNPADACRGATGPLLRTYTYRGRHEYSIRACAEPRAGGECIFAWWAKNTALAPKAIEKDLPVYRDPSGELWQLVDVDGCISEYNGEKKPLAGRFVARAVAKDGRTKDVQATFSACDVFGYAILGYYEEYKLPDCP